MSHHPLPPTPDEELLRQMIPDDCFWLAPLPGLSVSDLADNASNYAAFLDFSHRMNQQQDWIHSGSSIPQELQAALAEQPVGAFVFHENHCSLLEDKRGEIVNDSESSCSSGSFSAASSSYPAGCTAGEPQDRTEKTPSRADSCSQGTATADTNEPQNLTSRNSPLQDYSPVREKSSFSEENEEKPEISTK